MRRWVALCIGIALCGTGTVWILQGLDLLKGSFMTGHPFWAWMGAVAVMAGLPIAVRGGRRG